MNYLFKHLKEYFFPTYKFGCTDEKDIKDFNVGIFGLGDYVPKAQEKINPTVSVKHQVQNDCVYNAATVQHECDEGLPLSVRKLTTYAARKGYTSGNGFSSLQNGQNSLKDYGSELDMGSEEQETDWGKYVGEVLDAVDAGKRKIASYWSVSSRSDRLRQLDAGKVIATGMDWFTGFNLLQSPFLITKNDGIKVGGHSFNLIGYNLNYEGHKVYVAQNSFGSNWGVNGVFYIEMDYFDNVGYSCYLNLDIHPVLGAFLNKYDGKNVRGSTSTIYAIQAGVKKLYPNWATYLAYNGLVNGYVQLLGDDLAILDRVPNGDNMDIKLSDYWNQLTDIEKADDPQNNLISALMNLIYKK
jgi:hypothetical protein